MKKGTEKESLKRLIIRLEKTGRKEKVGLWIRTSELLRTARRRMVEVNANKIVECCKEGEIALVPGKLLGDGIIEKKVQVAAFEWTPAAKKRVEDAGGKVMSINELVDANVKGTGVRILR